MAKLHMYLLALSVWVLLFNFGGLIEGTGSSYLLSSIGLKNPENIASTTLYTNIIAVTTITLAGIAIGMALGKSADLVLLSTNILVANILFFIGWDLITLFNVLKLTNVYLATLIFSPLILIFFLTVLEWVRGMQT